MNDESPNVQRRRRRDEYLGLDGSPDDDEAMDPIPRIRTYQRLLMERVMSVKRLEKLSTLALREITMRLECKLYRRLLRTARTEQDRERYESRIKMRLDILTALAEAGDRGFQRGQDKRL